MAGNRDFKITIENTVTVNSAGSTVVGGAPIPTNPIAAPVTASADGTPQLLGMPMASGTGQGGGVGKAISAQFLVGAASRLLNASGNQQIAQTVGDIGRYAFLGARALGGDPTAIATLALDIATNAWEAARKNAEELNNAEEAQIRAGLMNLENVTIRKDFWTGRYIYSRD